MISPKNCIFSGRLLLIESTSPESFGIKTPTIIGERITINAIFISVTRLLSHILLKPDIKFTTWDDYAIMSMVECGLGISVLPELILRRIPYDICVKPLSVPAYRKIGVVFKIQKTLSAAAKEFLKYLDFRNG